MLVTGKMIFFHAVSLVSSFAIINRLALCFKHVEWNWYIATWFVESISLQCTGSTYFHSSKKYAEWKCFNFWKQQSLVYFHTVLLVRGARSIMNKSSNHWMIYWWKIPMQNGLSTNLPYLNQPLFFRLCS